MSAWPLAPPAPEGERFDPAPYPPIGDYALISDCESVALVGRNGSIDWCCMPHMDEDPCFGRLLDWRRGGCCSIAPADPGAATSTRAYAPGTMVLRTRYACATGRVELVDFFAIRGAPGLHDDSDQLVRIARCEVGAMPIRVDVVPRFHFGGVVPALREAGPGLFTGCGSNVGLVIHCSHPLRVDPRRAALVGEGTLHAGEALSLTIRFVRPEALGDAIARWHRRDGDAVLHLKASLDWWARWERNARRPPHPDPLTRRSALTLKALCFERTGAIAAAATTSLPEAPGGTRNWDYRFSWVRDSVLAVKALHALGFVREADRFRGFIERSAAGDARQLQPMFGLDGRRRLPEVLLPLEGWRGARPVRIGNAAAGQLQLDVYGSLLELAWLARGAARRIEPQYWAFLVDAVDVTCAHWHEPDHGIWEIRDAPRHFVHSKVMCWVAVDRAIGLATHDGLPAPLERWRAMRARIRDDVDRHGYDPELGVYVQAYGERAADAALLLLPAFGFVRHDDPRMLRTTDWVWRTLDRDGGLLLRYDRHDGLPEPEGAFIACTFWLAECLARQGRVPQAMRVYARAVACANPLGLFSEEFARDGGGMLGNFPQAFTHLSQITARLAIDAAVGGR